MSTPDNSTTPPPPGPTAPPDPTAARPGGRETTPPPTPTLPPDPTAARPDECETTPTPAPSGRPDGKYRHAWPLLVVITFLNSIGMSVVFPVLPFVVGRHVLEADLGWWVGLLEAVYAAGAFMVAPFLGALSDRVGRRPVIVLGLFGSALGFGLFGCAQTLWLLIVARVVQGLTAGDMPAMFGYVADITAPERRAKRFGFLGAVTGVAFMVGPAIGGPLARVNLALPVLTTAAIGLVVGLLCLVALPESLDPANRAGRLRLSQLHPFKVVADALARPRLRPLLIGFALITLPFMFFTSNFSVLALDTIAWGPTQVGLFLSVVGLLDLIIQGGLLGRLVSRWGERGVVLVGAAVQLAGCLGLAWTAQWAPWPVLLTAAALILAAGQGATTAALEALLSRQVGADEQGWLAGGVQAVTSAVQMAGPLLAGWLYSGLGHPAPYWLGAVL
ncbi:MAG: MFS transporter, partial [Propionibacteriaceae bacterium]|nr:MFS transporter [Propionibacteriaceae bacterium]